MDKLKRNTVPDHLKSQMEIEERPDADETDIRPSKAHQKLITAAFRDKNALYAAYMPFVQSGGLFIPTHKPYELGDEVFLLLQVMEEPEKIPLEGKIIWITPRRAQGNRMAGVGVQFFKEFEPVRNKIEVYLAGLLHSDRHNHTL